MLIEDQHPHNKSIMVAVLGAPNVGKSSLINCLLGTDLSVVTNKPQTTRNIIQGIYNDSETQIVFVDTEFTNFDKPDLISIGCATSNNHYWYSENSEFNRDGSTEWVIKNIYRYRIGDYRMLCKIQKNDIQIEAIRFAHRRESYKFF
jgi:GTPase SAR1 family protein